MKTNFLSYLKESVSVGYGIPHIEDLDTEIFIRMMENLSSLKAVQKLDGANLRLGIDSKNEIFTTREQKGGERFYSEKDFSNHTSNDGFRAAHLVIEKAQNYFLETLRTGECINLEILYGSQPNTVIYGKDGVNYIVLLEMVQGDDPSIIPDQSKIKDLYKKLKSQTFTVKSIRSDSVDGIQITKVPEVSNWKFSISDEVSVDIFNDLDIESSLKSLKNYLDTENEFAESQGAHLTNFEVLKEKSRIYTDEKKAINDRVLNDYKLPIKGQFLTVIEKLKPSLRGENLSDEDFYDGIEGVIFTDPSTNEKFKIVDREVFSGVNKFNYQVRNFISSKTVSVNLDLPRESRGGIIGEARIRAIKLLQLENAELPTQTKKVLSKFLADSKEQTIKNIVKSLNQLNFRAIHRKIQAIYITALDDLEDDLESFKSSSSGYEFNLPNGKTVKYTKEIKRRTLLFFAEARKQLIESMIAIKKCSDMEDLIEVFFNKQLDQIMNDKEKDEYSVKP